MMLRWPKQQSFGCNGLLMMIMKMLSEHLQEIYPYSESLVFKTVNWPGTNILVFSMYTVLLQLSEGSKYLKRITNFRKRKRTLFGESCFLGSSSTLQKGFYLLKKLSLFCVNIRLMLLLLMTEPFLFHPY